METTKQIAEIFDYYKTFHPRAKLGTDQKKCIGDRLKDGYTVEEIKMGIDFVHHNPFHCGDNELKKTYQKITLVCRNSEKLLEYIEQEEARLSKERRDQVRGREKIMADVRAREEFEKSRTVRFKKV